MTSSGESVECFSAALRANDIIKRGAVSVSVQEAIPLRARNDVFDAVVGRLMDRTKPVRKQALATAATFLRSNPYGDTLKACTRPALAPCSCFFIFDRRFCSILHRFRPHLSSLFNRYLKKLLSYLHIQKCVELHFPRRF
jgi:hypothetical protein